MKRAGSGVGAWLDLSRWPMLLLLVAGLGGLTAASVYNHRASFVLPKDEPIIPSIYNQRIYPRARPMVSLMPPLEFREFVVHDGSVVEWEDQWARRPRDDQPSRVCYMYRFSQSYGLWFRSIKTGGWNQRFVDFQSQSQFVPDRAERAVFEASIQRDPRVANQPRSYFRLNAGAALDLVGISMSLLLILSVFLNLRRFLRPKAHFACHSCGYDLSGLPTPTCPECGLNLHETPRA